MRDITYQEDSDEFDVDEPEEFEESDSDWDPEEEAGNKRKGRPKTASPKKINSFKKKKVEKKLTSSQLTESRVLLNINGTTASVAMKAFTNGSFVVLKSDIKSNENPPLWKIDGKALLQKYIPFNQDGKTLYKNTSTYSGWTPSNQANYVPAPVTYVQQGKKEIIVEFNRDKVSLDDGKDEGDEEKNEKPEAVASDSVETSLAT